MDPVDEDSSRRLWASYVAAHPEFIDESPPTERFGDSAEMADELLDVVRNGPKRATAGLVAEYVHEHESLGTVGDHWIVADGPGRPPLDRAADRPPGQCGREVRLG